jgi:porphobilinogen synthase
MPEVFRYGYENINEYLEPLVLKGLKSILVFGILSDDSTKDPEGTRASAENGPA